MDLKHYNLEKIMTKDGSFTLYVKELDEYYHSVNGAVTESLHVFIKNGLERVEKPNLNILEIGFGTGLNALLTAICSKKNIVYHSLEPFPLDLELYSKISKTVIEKYDFNSAEINCLYDAVLKTEWDSLVEINEKFSLKKHKQKLEDFSTEIKFDLVYYDAFSPQVQPELWTKSIFEKIYNFMNKNAVITTYCAKGQVRRDWQSVGFKVERIPGPPGKREMLVALK